MAQTIVRAPRLIDGTGRPPAERMEVVIGGNRVDGEIIVDLPADLRHG